MKKEVWDYDTDIEAVKRENVTHLTSAPACLGLLEKRGFLKNFFRCKYPTQIS